jgi:murein DD-endopeptidase MepM/ murein hydrolase activator NlpD
MTGFGYRIAPVLIALLLSACVSGARVLSGFGDLRDGEGNPRNGPHGGVDVWGSPGDPVLASADGRVQDVGEEPGVSCGKYVMIGHEPKVEVGGDRLDGGTRYCHLREQSVSVGDTVKRGQTIGYIGTTGWTRSPTKTTGYEHVHWELRTFGKMDPLPFTVGCFDPKQGYPADRLVLTYPVQCKNKN